MGKFIGKIFGIIVFLTVLSFGVACGAGYVNNNIKLSRCDFQAPYKVEKTPPDLTAGEFNRGE